MAVFAVLGSVIVILLYLVSQNSQTPEQNLALKQRLAFASKCSHMLLSAGIDLNCHFNPGIPERLTLRGPRVNRVTAYQVMHTSEFVAAVRIVGFDEIELTDETTFGFEEVHRID